MKAATTKLFALLAMVAALVAAVAGQPFDWSDGPAGDRWAKGCDIPFNDLRIVPVGSLPCGAMCAGFNGCTHWAWNTGKCWLKGPGRVTTDDAIAFNGDGYSACGIMR